MVAFEPRDSMTPSRLICVGSNGVLLGWSDFSGDQPKLSFRLESEEEERKKRKENRKKNKAKRLSEMRERRIYFLMM